MGLLLFKSSGWEGVFICLGPLVLAAVIVGLLALFRTPETQQPESQESTEQLGVVYGTRPSVSGSGRNSGQRRSGRKGVSIRKVVRREIKKYGD